MGKNNNIQMDISKRRIIEKSLNDGEKETLIANILTVHKSTISREIKNYRYVISVQDDKPSLCWTCKNNIGCSYHHKCGRSLCGLKCLNCKSLISCDKYVGFSCNIEIRFPFVCNGCKRFKQCGKTKFLYDANKANEAALKIRRESRIGLNMTPEEYHFIDSTLRDGNQKGQSIFHIIKANDIGRCPKSIYNYINSGIVSVKPIDLPRAVTLKKRKKRIPSKYEYNENRNIDRQHRMYSDWLVFQAKNRVIIYWQMDFLGAPKKSEQQILTLTIPQFQFVYLIPIKYPNSTKIKEIFDYLENKLGSDFNRVFEAILTDRDCKFNSFREIEINDDGVVRTHMFFCNPSASNEKPSVENFNHQIRSIFKKGVNLNNITVEQCNVICSHLNSRFLNSIDGRRSCDLFIEYFGEEIFVKLGLKIIDPKKVKILSFKKY